MKFNGLILTDKIGSSPAAVHLRSGVLHINPEIFFSYPKEWQKFIVLHEMGHWILQTRSEEKADNFAFHHFIESGESLKDAVESLLRVLDVNDDAHRKRIEVLLNKAKFYDSEIYGKEFKTPKERKEAMSDYLQTEHANLAYCLGKNDCEGAKAAMANILVVVDPQMHDKLLDKFATLLADVQMQKYNGQYLDDMAYFFCFGNKSCLARKDKKAEAKADLIRSKGVAKELKAQSKVIRAEAKQTRADAKLSLADQGIQDTTVKDAFKNITDLGGKVAGAFIPGMNQQQPLAAETPTGMPEPTDDGGGEQPKKSNTGLIIGIIVAIIVIAAIIAFIMLRKKK